MKRQLSPIRGASVCLAVLVALLSFACGGESSAPTPPAPPPFQPQTIVVQLGSNGGATTLISTQSGGWTRNGQAFTSGSTVTGENSASYRLTLSNGTWRAEFVAPDPEPVALGASGDAVLLQAQEDGSYHLDGEPLASGKVVSADNGNQYRLVLATGGAWMAEFVPPQPQVVSLGTSGDSRQVGRLENGTYTLDGAALDAGTVVAARNGNQYTLNLGADGLWTAAYVVGDPQRLLLGTSGDPPLLVYRQENGTFRLNDEPLLGGRIVQANNGNRYRLQLGAGGIWSATFLASAVTVRLGQFGGSVSLVPNEDGTWQRGPNLFSSGDTVTGRNGFEYRLTLVGDGWAVEVLPMTVNVAVTGSDATIALARSEDGTYRYDNVPVASGDTIRAGASTYTLRFASGRWTAVFVQGEIVVSLPAGDSVTLIKNASGNYEYNGTRIRSGSLVRSPATGIRYRLRLSNGEWSGSVYVPPTIGGGGGGEPGGGTPPVVSEDIKSALPSAITGTTEDQIRPGLSDVSDIEYGAYAGSGRFQDDTFVESVIREIDKILGPIDSKGLADGNDSEQFVARVLIDNNWGNVKTALEKIFGSDSLTLTANPPKSGSETDVSASLRRLRDLKDNLADVNEFKREYKTQIARGDGSSTSNNGDTIFKARKEVVALASTTNTRFGIRLTANPDNNANSSPIAYTTRQVFAYSPLSRTPEAALPTRGTARYSGRTWALDSSNLLYSGAIELLVSLGIARVDATVSGLRRSDNNASWQHEGDEVREIKLPRAEGSNFAGENDHFSRTGADATVVYSGVAVDRTVSSSDLKGQFVGTAADQKAGIAVIGTWKVGENVLKGSYGAERGTTRSSRLPSVDSSVRSYVESTDVTEDRTAKKVNLPNFAGDDADADRFNLSSGDMTKTHGTGDAKVTARLRIQSTSLTRFGAWNVAGTDRVSDDRGVLAFSPLAAATYNSGDSAYPRRVSATYSGRTVAVDGAGTFYSGNYKLSVDWNSGSVGGNIRAEISSLSGGSGRFHLGGQAVSRIGYTDSFSGVTFESADARVYFTNGTDRTISSQGHSGTFVGSGGPDGPYGVIGTWSLTENTDTIQGGFGANLVPAP